MKKVQLCRRSVGRRFDRCRFFETKKKKKKNKKQEKAQKLEFRLRPTCTTRNLQAYQSPCNVSQFPASQIRTRKFPGQRAVRIPRLAPIVPDKRTTRRDERTQPCFLDESERKREREKGLHRGCLPHPLLGPRHIQVELNEESRATGGRQKISSSRRQRISFSTRCPTFDEKRRVPALACQ